MKHYKLSIINSAIAGILICAMLAACGAAEQQPGGNLSETGSTPGAVDNAADPVTDSQPEDTDEPVTEPDIDVSLPETSDPEDTEPEVTEPETTEPEVSDPVVKDPEENSSSGVLDSNIANTIIETASAQLGVPYTYGGSTPEEGFDSSGFTYYCVRSAGIDFPRMLKDQLDAGEKIAYSDLTPGDIAYFAAEAGKSASFCGVYVGGGLIIYSPVPDQNVKTANITTNYWTTRFVTGIRPSVN